MAKKTFCWNFRRKIAQPYPDTIAFETLELDDFEWINLQNIEMELVDLKNSIWARKFSDLRFKVEMMEINRLNNQEKNNYENEIAQTWNNLPDEFSNLKNLSMALLTIFSSTYFCETLFSDLNYIKSNKRNRLTDDVSEACVVLKNTKYEPDIKDLAKSLTQRTIFK
jgi:hypothetical protein